MRSSLSKATKGLLVGGVVAAMATPVFAATQGPVGFTSTGDVTITLGVADEVQISNLADIPLTTAVGLDSTGSSDACIYRNTAGAYQITATGSGPAAAFELTDGANSVAYTVEYDDLTVAGAQTLTTGTPVGGFTGADTSTTCANVGGTNGSIDVTVAAAAAAALPASSYVGLLTLVVAPN